MIKTKTSRLALHNLEPLAYPESRDRGIHLNLGDTSCELQGPRNSNQTIRKV